MLVKKTLRDIFYPSAPKFFGVKMSTEKKPKSATSPGFVNPVEFGRWVEPKSGPAVEQRWSAFREYCQQNGISEDDGGTALGGLHERLIVTVSDVENGRATQNIPQLLAVGGVHLEVFKLLAENQEKTGKELVQMLAEGRPKKP